jgi:hypothetical protein
LGIKGEIMRKETKLLKACLQELERIFINAECMHLVGPDERLMQKVGEHLKEALKPVLAGDLVFVEPGDECQCGAMATDERNTHWSVYRFCSDCVKAYDMACRDGRTYQEAGALQDAGADPYGAYGI